MGAITRLADLSEQDRRSLEGWLEEHARGWYEGSLDDSIKELRSMAECPWRLLAVISVVKLDLKQQWQLGRKVALEKYLEAYAELGGKSGVAADLIWAEMTAKTKAGVAVDLEDYIQAYPNQAAELRSLVAAASSAAAGSTRKMRQQTSSTPRPVSAPAPAPAPATPRTAKSTPMPSAGSAPSARPAEPQSAMPEMFGRYRIEKQLGQGGMGSVYKAYDTELYRHVALKVPQFGPEEGAEVLERFKQEARAAATLRHTNLCQVYDVGAIDGTNFLTMEFIQGQSLEGYVTRQKEVSQRFIALVMTKLARALKTAHAKNVIHRDLKPSNIMLRDADGTLEPVIVDFGLARRIDPGTARLTQSGLVIGTWQYMTPEQLCGEPDALGPGCDIYALGVIMYELLTGRLPFDAPGQVVRGNPAAPSSLRADLDPRLEAICVKAMAASRDARYASMGDLATALTDYLRSATDKSPEVKAAIAPSGPVAPEPKPTALTTQDVRPSSATWKIVAGTSVAVVAVVGGSVGLWSWMARRPGMGRPAAPDRPGIAKKAGAGAPTAVVGGNPERLMDEAWRAIRAGQFAEAHTALTRYLGDPASSKKSEARSLLADLDHALSKTEPRTRAKALGDAELKKHVDEGVKDMLDMVQTPEMRDAYAANLMEALRQEHAARSAAARGDELASNTREPAAKKKAFLPRPAPLRPVPVRELEPGFKPIFRGPNEGWEAYVWQNPPPAKKGMPKLGPHYEPCGPFRVAHRDGNTLVSERVVGILSMKELNQITSWKFDYTIASEARRALPKAGNATHAAAELLLDKPVNLGNTIGCSVIAVSLLAGDAGELTTRRPNRREIATQSAAARAARQNGEWNEMEIKCGDRSIEFVLNGALVNRLEIPRRINTRVGFSFGNVELHLTNIRLH
jgi:predicted Ser/Thr protein kinase